MLKIFVYFLARYLKLSTCISSDQPVKKNISSGAGPKSKHHRLPDLLSDSASCAYPQLAPMCQTIPTVNSHQKKTWKNNNITSNHKIVFVFIDTNG